MLRKTGRINKLLDAIATQSLRETNNVIEDIYPEL